MNDEAMLGTCDGRKVGYNESLNGKSDDFVYAGRCRPVTHLYQFCRKTALTPCNNYSSRAQKIVCDATSHTSSSSHKQRNNPYELLMEISIKKKATQTYPTSRQNTISAFVQGIPMLSWTIK